MIDGFGKNLQLHDSLLQHLQLEAKVLRGEMGGISRKSLDSLRSELQMRLELLGGTVDEEASLPTLAHAVYTLSRKVQFERSDDGYVVRKPRLI